jgi:hypothetical protein
MDQRQQAPSASPPLGLGLWFPAKATMPTNLGLSKDRLGTVRALLTGGAIDAFNVNVATDQEGVEL